MYENRRSCPAVKAVCHNFDNRGHFAKVCKSKAKDVTFDVLVVSAAEALTSINSQDCERCFFGLCSVRFPKWFSIAAAPRNKFGPFRYQN